MNGRYAPQSHKRVIRDRSPTDVCSLTALSLQTPRRHQKTCASLDGQRRASWTYCRPGTLHTLPSPTHRDGCTAYSSIRRWVKPALFLQYLFRLRLCLFVCGCGSGCVHLRLCLYLGLSVCLPVRRTFARLVLSRRPSLMSVSGQELQHSRYRIHAHASSAWQASRRVRCTNHASAAIAVVRKVNPDARENDPVVCCPFTSCCDRGGPIGDLCRGPGRSTTRTQRQSTRELGALCVDATVCVSYKGVIQTGDEFRQTSRLDGRNSAIVRDGTTKGFFFLASDMRYTTRPTQRARGLIRPRFSHDPWRAISKELQQTLFVKVTHSALGKTFLKAFVVGICGAPTDWNMADIADDFIKEVRSALSRRKRPMAARVRRVDRRCSRSVLRRKHGGRPGSG